MAITRRLFYPFYYYNCASGRKFPVRCESYFRPLGLKPYILGLVGVSTIENYNYP